MGSAALQHREGHWRHSAVGAGVTGEGIDVAVTEPGVNQSSDFSGRLVNGPDLSFDLRSVGGATTTAMATARTWPASSAGSASGADPGGTSPNDPSDFLGMAPDARIVSIKVADAHGATDVSQVIAAIDWVVQHRHDNGMNIRVLNLSFGTDRRSRLHPRPSDLRVERAWFAGIVAVASVGPEGLRQRRARRPDIRPVRPSPSAPTPTARLQADDTCPDFSQAVVLLDRRADLVAQSKSVVAFAPSSSPSSSARSPDGRVRDRFRSRAADFAGYGGGSRPSALVLERGRSLDPDQVKQILTTTATPYALGRRRRGAGPLNLASGIRGDRPRASSSRPQATGPRGRPTKVRASRAPRPEQRHEGGRASATSSVTRSVAMSGNSRQLLVRQLMERQQLVRQLLERQLLVGQLLVGQLLVRQLLVGQLLVGQLVVGELVGSCWLLWVQWPTKATQAPAALDPTAGTPKTARETHSVTAATPSGARPEGGRFASPGLPERSGIWLLTGMLGAVCCLAVLRRRRRDPATFRSNLDPVVGAADRLLPRRDKRRSPRVPAPGAYVLAERDPAGARARLCHTRRLCRWPQSSERASACRSAACHQAGSTSATSPWRRRSPSSRSI